MILRQALRLLWREWQGGELRLLLAALVIAVSASGAVGFFTDRVERALARQATEFIGADLVIRSSQALPGAFALEAQRLGLAQGQQRTLRSMLIHADRMLLVGLKAVDASYPMRGELRLSDSPGGPPRAQRKPPAPGTLWVEPRVLEQLQANVGDEVELGLGRFRLDALLQHEPDRGGGLFSLNPRVMMHLDDLPATALVQPGSRIRYRYLYSGGAAAIAQFRAWLKPRLREGDQLLRVDDESPALGGTLQRAQRYLNLSGLLAAAMASVAIAMAARRYTERHYDSAALLRSFGLSRRRILQLFGLQLLLCGILAALLGVAAGWLAQQGLVALLGPLISAELPGAGWRPALVGIATGLLILVAATLPALLQLAAVAPLRVLRRELTPLPPASLLIYALASLCGTLLLWLYCNDLPLALLIGAGGVLGSLLLAAGGWLLLCLVARLPGPLAWRLSRNNLLRHPRASLTQLTAFGLTLAAMALILLVRSDLLDAWQRQLPDDAPNHFLINIQPAETDALGAYLATAGIPHAGLFPLVRGRLTHINALPAEPQLAADHPGRRATRRELNLTWSDRLPADNRLVAGRWWQPADRGRRLISLEQRLAADLGVGVGDRLRFRIGDQPVEAQILSLRQLDWRTLRPNFYVIFAPGALDDLPATAMTSFYLPSARRGELSALLDRFPTLTLLEVDALLGNIRRIVAQVSLAVEYVLLFVLAAGISVLFAGLRSSLDARLQEGALLRSLGAPSRLLRRMLALEFLLLGALAGLLATGLTWGVGWWLYGLLELDYRIDYRLLLLAPTAGALLVGSAGWLATRHMLRHSPLSLLRAL